MILKSKGIVMRLADKNDASFILSLRLDKELGKFLSPTDPYLLKQTNWLIEYQKREKEEKEYYFIFEDENQKPWGTIRLYNFQGDSFTYGSWLCKPNAPDCIAIKADFLCRDFAFFQLNFENCLLDVRKGNKEVLGYHKRFGSLPIGEDQLNYYFNLPKEIYIENKAKLIRLLNLDF
jgi:hypothetical protein